MSKERILHFTIGPVQSFVAQARRTRDLWAGSFLLSWLAGQAMRTIEKRFGRIDFPSVQSDALYGALTGQGGTPRVGSLPNRFRAVIEDRNTDPGSACAAAVREKWTALAIHVWDTFLKDAAASGGTIDGGPAAIWKRQVAHMWDINWVVGDSTDGSEDGAWLDQRKNWRTWMPPPEPGDHCMLMGDWQELSGCIRAGDEARQKAFWERVRDTVANEL